MQKHETIRAMLAVGRHWMDGGRALQVAELILAKPRKVSQLIECLWDEDAGVACRAADALERATYRQPKLAQAWKESLIGLMAEAEQNKLRWNLALLVPRLELSVTEARRVAVALRSYLDDRGSIVKTAAMHGLTALTRHDPELMPEVVDMLRILSRSGTPAMRARGRILLKQLEASGKRRILSPQRALLTTRERPTMYTDLAI
jgi:hypothetical protein